MFQASSREYLNTYELLFHHIMLAQWCNLLDSFGPSDLHGRQALLPSHEAPHVPRNDLIRLLTSAGKGKETMFS
jgi:hypothetical protein